MLKDVARYDKGEIKVDAKITDDGYIRANAIVTRTGIFYYRNNDGTIRKEFRPSDQVFNQDSLESLKMIPITNGHPPERLVNAKNAKRLAIGFTGENIKVQEPYLMANILITDEDGVKAVKELGRKELSLGYTVDLLEEPGEYEGEKYDFVQTNIKYNHLSLVDQGRAGPAARIALDRLDAEEITLEEVMTEKQTKKDEMMSAEMTQSGDISNLRDEVERLKSERMEFERRLKQMADEMEALRAERDSMKDRMSERDMSKEKNDAIEKFREAIKARMKLEDAGRKLLNKDMISKMDAMDDVDLKKAIIKTKFPQANLDGQSEIYINGRFDGVLETLATYKSSEDVFLKSTSSNNDSVALDPADARKKMIERNKNAWKR